MKKNLLSFLFLVSIQALFGQRPNVIPVVADYQPAKGKFTVSEKTVIKFPDSFSAEADAFIQLMKNAYGFSLQKGDAASNVIEIKTNEQNAKSAYGLSVTSDKITVSSNGNEGGFYGLMTVLQLMNNKKNEVTCGEIKDEPQYSWRGMHLDVARHFFPVSFVKKYIDLLALHKMNRFHWHLTDDQGWRIEIKKYPLLTKKGAWRKGSMSGHARKQRYDTVTHGGFYTQQEIKDIVAYAAARQITVVPEIEMPGHSLAALAAYPQYACKDTSFSVERGWGVFEDVYCTKEETFTFLQDVLSEVIELFPSEYIHIGGDECPKSRWKNCLKCQERIKKEGLKNEEELQSYFVRRIEKFVNAKGRKIIGWDEILEGGLAPNAAVMSWRGTDGGEKAAKEGHPVVMSPGSHCYFDHYQSMAEFEPVAIGGFTALEKVYSYSVTPEFIPADKQKFVLGAQGNLWSEYLYSPKDVEYMALPRMSALAEVLWSKPVARNWDDFTSRLAEHFTLLEKLKVNYSRALYDVSYKTQQKSSLDGYDVVLSAACKGVIRYTTDGTDPNSKSTEYKSPFSFDKGTTVKAALFIDGKQAGRIMKKEFMISMASGRGLKFNKAPDHSQHATFGLVNGILESSSEQRANCTVWKNDDANFTVDLGGQKEVKKVTLYFLQDGKNFIVQPRQVYVYYTTDGSRYKIAGKAKFAYSGEDYMKMEITFEPFVSNLVKVTAANPGKVTAGTVSHNEDLWLYLDEVVIE